jgi:hypothetical protein
VGCQYVTVEFPTVPPSPRQTDAAIAEANLALECMVTLCLAGPKAEREFCGPLNDGSDRVDHAMAREYLARRIANPLQPVAKTRPLPSRGATVGPFGVGAAPHLFARRRFSAKREFEWR